MGAMHSNLCYFLGKRGSLALQAGLRFRTHLSKQGSKEQASLPWLPAVWVGSMLTNTGDSFSKSS